MTKFPGVIRRIAHGAVKLDAEQEAWLIKWFPVTENKRLSKAMGISIDALRDYARRLGVKGKSEAGLRAITERAAKASAKTNERNGNFARKRGKRPSDATIEGLRRRWKEVHDGLKLSPVEIMKEKDPEGFAEKMRMKGEKIKELYKKEQRRIIYGLSRHTNLNIVLKKYTRSQVHHRNNALKRGYLLDTDCSEGSEGRYTIYYDEETRRSAKFESNCIKDGFVFKKDD